MKFKHNQYLFILCATLFLLLANIGFSQALRHSGNGLVTGDAADFSSPHAVIAFPAIPVAETKAKESGDTSDTESNESGDSESSKPADSDSESSQSDETDSESTTLEETDSETPQSEVPNPEESQPETPNLEESQPENSESESSKPEDLNSELPQSDEIDSELTTLEEAGSEIPNLEETQPEIPNLEESQPENSDSESPTSENIESSEKTQNDDNIDIVSESPDEKVEAADELAQSKNYPEDYFGMSLFGVHIFYEFGDVDGLLDKFDQVKENLASDSNFTLSDAQANFNSIKNFVRDIAEKGYVISNVKLNLLTPLIWYSEPLGGVAHFELNWVGGLYTTFDAGEQPVRLSAKYPECDDFINSPDDDQAILNCVAAVRANADEAAECVAYIEAAEDQGEALSQCDIFRITSDSKANFSGFFGYQSEIGYSRSLGELNLGDSDLLRGDIFLGANLKYSMLETFDLDYRYDSQEEDASITDQIDENKMKSNLYALDTGVKFVSNKYELGLGIDNILAGELNYDSYSVKPARKPYLVSSIYFLRDQENAISLNLYEDLAKETTILGTENKWRVYGLSMTFRDFFISSLRVSRRHNLLGSKYTYNQFGVSLFDFISMNLSVSESTFNTGQGTLYNSAFFNTTIDLNF